MKKVMSTLLTIATLALATTAFAATHSMDHGSMDHGDMKMDASMIMLPEQSVEGVTAQVHIKDVKATMAKMGMKHTHHFMVVLSDAKTGKRIEPQLVAVKIIDPAGKEAEAVELMSMEGHSGADVILANPGEYRFKVAAKLADGKKVQYEFKTTIK